MPERVRQIQGAVGVAAVAVRSRPDPYQRRWRRARCTGKHAAAVLAAAWAGRQGLSRWLQSQRRGLAQSRRSSRRSQETDQTHSTCRERCSRSRRAWLGAELQLRAARDIARRRCASSARSGDHRISRQDRARSALSYSWQASSFPQSRARLRRRDLRPAPLAVSAAREARGSAGQDGSCFAGRDAGSVSHS
jgi:hypothetical protein